MIKYHIPNIDSIASTFRDFLSLEVMRTSWEKLPLIDYLDEWTVFHFNIKFFDLVVSDLEVLKKVKRKIDQNGIQFPEYVDYLKVLYKNFSYKSSGIGAFPLVQRINAFDIVDMFGGIVCPYCNRSRITNRANKGTRTCEIDHFFSQSRYPLFSVCFFNLVPSCEPCNGQKNQVELGISPYDSKRIHSLSSFSYKGLKSRGTLELKFHPKKEMVVNDIVLDLKGTYANEIPELDNILELYKRNPLNKLKNDVSNRKNGYRDLRHAIEVTYQTKLNETDFGFDTYSKLYHDILKKLYGL